ncbi:hypothetical protein ACSSS7_006278 [Eimeria intestinalis]
MELFSALWAVLSVALCLYQARASQLLAGVLRRMRGCTPALATEKIAGLLRRTASSDRRGITSSIAHKAIRPLVVAFCRPFERSLLRRLLDCTSSGAPEAESEDEVDDVDAQGSADAGKTSVGWQEEEMRNVWSSIGRLPTTYLLKSERLACFALVQCKSKGLPHYVLECCRMNSCECVLHSGMGLDVLPSGAYLLTVESAGYKVPSNDESKEADADAKTIEETSGKQQSRDRRGAASPNAESSFFGRGGGGAAKASVGSPCATEAALIASLAAPVLEAADVLLLPLVYQGVVGGVAPPHPLHQARPVSELLYSQEAAETAAETSPGISGSVGEAGDLEAEARQAPVVCLPEGVLMLLRSMKQLTQQHAAQRAAAAGGLQGSRTASGALMALSKTRLPHIVLLLGEPLSPDFEAAVKAKVLTELGDTEGKSGAAVCLVHHKLQEKHSKAPSREPLGARMQRILCGALSSFDLQTRRFQLALDRKILREELQLSLEREARTLYVREALQIEAEAKARLRAALIRALQKDATRFGAVAPAILTERRPWLGVSVRPSLAMTTLLRLRGEGNLQGYSRYNTGAINFLFG